MQPQVFPLNPYIAGNPVNGSNFIGRSDVVREIKRVLCSSHENALVLFGQRRIGKTSLLQMLATRLPQEGPYYTVQFDLQDKAAMPLTEVIEQLASSVARDLDLPLPESWNEVATTKFREHFLPKVLTHLPDGSSLVLLFDEFDVLDNPSATQAGAVFFPYLRELLQSGNQRIQFIFVIGRRPEDLSSLTLSVFKGVKSQHVTLFSAAETSELVRLSEYNGTLQWSNDAVDRVYTLAGGHPFLTQQLCQHIWEMAYQEESEGLSIISVADVDAMISQTLQSATNSLEWLWNGLQPAERIIASALAGTGPSYMSQIDLEHKLLESGVRVYMRELKDAPRVLQEWNLIHLDSHGYRFPVELLRQWIEIRKPLSRTWQEVERLQPDAENLYQAAYTFYRLGDLSQSLPLLRQAVTINPNHLNAIILLSEGLIAIEEWSAAEKLLKDLYENHPAAARPRLVQVLLSQAATAKLTSAEEIALYEYILELDPNNKDAFSHLRAVWREMGEQAMSVRSYAEAISAFEKAGLLEQINKAKAAQESFVVHEGLRQIANLEQIRDYKAAVKIAVDLHRLYPSHSKLPDLPSLQAKSRLRSLYEEGVQALQSGNSDLAKKRLVQVIGLEPDYEEAVRYLYILRYNSFEGVAELGDQQIAETVVSVTAPTLEQKALQSTINLTPKSSASSNQPYLDKQIVDSVAKQVIKKEKEVPPIPLPQRFFLNIFLHLPSLIMYYALGVGQVPISQNSWPSWIYFWIMVGTMLLLLGNMWIDENGGGLMLSWLAVMTGLVINAISPILGFNGIGVIISGTLFISLLVGKKENNFNIFMVLILYAGFPALSAGSLIRNTAFGDIGSVMVGIGLVMTGLIIFIYISLSEENYSILKLRYITPLVLCTAFFLWFCLFSGWRMFESL